MPTDSSDTTSGAETHKHMFTEQKHVTRPVLVVLFKHISGVWRTYMLFAAARTSMLLWVFPSPLSVPLLFPEH